MLRQRFFVAIAFLFLIVPTVAVSEEPADFKKGELEHLVGLIGTYEYKTFMEDPTVAYLIESILDEEEKRHFFSNMQPVRSIEFIGGDFRLMGGRADQEDTENAILMINSSLSTILIGIRMNGRMTAFKRSIWGSDHRYLQDGFQDWLYQDEIREAMRNEPKNKIEWQ